MNKLLKYGLGFTAGAAGGAADAYNKYLRNIETKNMLGKLTSKDGKYQEETGSISDFIQKAPVSKLWGGDRGADGAKGASPEQAQGELDSAGSANLATVNSSAGEAAFSDAAPPQHSSMDELEKYKQSAGEVWAQP